MAEPSDQPPTPLLRRWQGCLPAAPEVLHRLEQLAGAVLMLLLAIAAALVPGRELFLQSDVREVIEPMVALTELSGCFERPSEDARPWRLDNPLPVPTERERYVLEQGLPVYRVLYRRNHQALPERTDLENRWQEIDNPADGLPSDS